MTLVPVQQLMRGLPFRLDGVLYYRDSICQVGRTSLVKCYKCEKRVLNFKAPTWLPLDTLVEPIPI